MIPGYVTFSYPTPATVANIANIEAIKSANAPQTSRNVSNVSSPGRGKVRAIPAEEAGIRTAAAYRAYLAAYVPGPDEDLPAVPPDVDGRGELWGLWWEAVRARNAGV